MQSDSLDKIVTRYLATVARESFIWEGKTYSPKLLKVSPLLLRDYTCPPGCGGCCFKFTLDYLPSEKKPPGAKKRVVIFNDRKIEIWSDGQESNETKRCQHLEPGTGRCGIYTRRPFTCDFELIRTLQAVDDPDRANVLTQKLFGRGWSYARTDGGKGAKCEMREVTPESIKEVIRKLERLKEWADHFGLDTWLPDLLTIIREGRLTHQIVFNPRRAEGFGL